MDRDEEEERKKLTEESVRRVGDVIGTEMVAVIAIGVAVSNAGGGGYVIRFDSILLRLVLSF
ncbi:hypothetical protein L195_g003029 [Trifolium pratense]|uniref:Uncharacterized protein n=1 Tax=Trifolium pratense TaxID=57577 RepID=A0A2K3NU39_TRIPR|nr:hypothetical protein L195_g003029 [Trifolium pratense]